MCLPSFSHFLIVNKTWLSLNFLSLNFSLSLSLSLSQRSSLSCARSLALSNEVEAPGQPTRLCGGEALGVWRRRGLGKVTLAEGMGEEVKVVCHERGTKRLRPLHQLQLPLTEETAP